MISALVPRQRVITFLVDGEPYTPQPIASAMAGFVLGLENRMEMMGKGRLVLNFGHDGVTPELYESFDKIGIDRGAQVAATIKERVRR